jgi:serine/threonine-protein kinase
MPQILTPSKPVRVSGPIAASDPVAAQLKQWQLIYLAAEGAFTRVYRARPVGCPEGQPPRYAVKTLRSVHECDPQVVAMLRREATVGRTVSNPHVVSILAAEVNEPPYFVVMPWLRGDSLATRLANRRALPAAVAFWIARQVAEALDALWAADWMHGDVKPANIFVSPEGHVTLLDLGFAGRLSRKESFEQRSLTGTSYYLAPEKVTTRPEADIRSDLYSLGVVLFEMLTGRVPFEGKDASELARQHREARLPDIAKSVAGLPPGTTALMRELLAKQPLRRPQTPRELVDRLVPLELATLGQR